MRHSLAVRALSGLAAEDDFLVGLHLRGCRSCRAEQESDAWVMSLLSTVPAPEPVPTVYGRRRPAPGVMAWALATALIVGGCLLGRAARRRSGAHTICPSGGRW
ncbi:hypothetical protein [Streptomyces fumanus]|uniref:hypothetical protein n=1 Tax=Streptomyces fumanus TaxID=67302 RepID=UPI00167CA7D9|nr:hypothetical protein [Streptomyces fumanus]